MGFKVSLVNSHKKIKCSWVIRKMVAGGRPFLFYENEIGLLSYFYPTYNFGTKIISPTMTAAIAEI